MKFGKKAKKLSADDVLIARLERLFGEPISPEERVELLKALKGE